MVHIFDDELTVESVNELISKLNSFEESTILYFSTVGGSPIATEALVNYLNTHWKEDLILVFTGVVASAGVSVLIGFEGEKYLSDNLDWVLLHAMDRTNMGHTRLKKYEKNYKKFDNEEDKKNIKIYKKLFGLTKEEEKVFFEGEDIVIERDNFKRLNIPLWRDFNKNLTENPVKNN